MVYSVCGVRSNTAELTEILADCVLNPKFNSWEVDTQIARLQEDLKAFKSNQLGLLQEVSAILETQLGDIFSTTCIE